MTQIPKVNLEVTKRSFYFTGAMEFNSLSRHIKTTCGCKCVTRRTCNLGKAQCAFDIQAKATTVLKNHLATIGMMFPWQSYSFKQECHDFLVIISTFYLILAFYSIGSD